MTNTYFTDVSGVRSGILNKGHININIYLQDVIKKVALLSRSVDKLLDFSGRTMRIGTVVMKMKNI